METNQFLLLILAALLSIIAVLLVAILRRLSTRPPSPDSPPAQTPHNSLVAELIRIDKASAVVQTVSSGNVSTISAKTPSQASPDKSKQEDDEQNEALKRMMSDLPAIFLTGAAGTGKSFLLKRFVKEFPGRCVIVAPTGMVALNAGGQTIHSFFRLPPKALNPEDIKVVENQTLYKAVDVIVIDEVSMVRADVMDAIDVFMRKNGRDRSRPFGGARVIFVGDLYQLPPVVRGKQEQRFLEDRYGGPYFFAAPVFNECPMEVIELKQVRRQTDVEFIKILNAVRLNDINMDQLAWLNETAHTTEPINPHAVTLTPTRAAASRINLDRLAALQGMECGLEAGFEGDLMHPEQEKEDDFRLPVDATLRLKTGAQVMFVKNDLNERWVNGTLGLVVSVLEDLVVVQIDDDEGGKVSVDVARERWSKIRYEYDSTTKRIESRETGAVEQFPLTLAWAVTIHKSQGATYDNVNVDLGSGAFADGQTYVALSRCRTPQGLMLAKPLKRLDIRIDPHLADWRQRIGRAQKARGEVRKRFRNLSSESPTS